MKTPPRISDSEKPRAKRDDIIVSEVEDEVLLFDVRKNRAHALNRTAAEVWRACDGATTIQDLSVHLERLGVRPAGEAVSLALRQLSQADLIWGGYDSPMKDGLSRREFGRRAGQVGLAATVAPFVASIVAPTALAANSPICPSGPCTNDDDCKVGGNASSCHCTTSRSGGPNVCVPK